MIKTKNMKKHWQLCCQSGSGIRKLCATMDFILSYGLLWELLGFERPTFDWLWATHHPPDKNILLWIVCASMSSFFAGLFWCHNYSPTEPVGTKNTLSLVPSSDRQTDRLDRQIKRKEFSFSSWKLKKGFRCVKESPGKRGGPKKIIFLVVFYY